MGRAESVPVAIIGGGVVGVSMAVALARQGVASVVLERRDAPNSHPRAHVCNPRTMEIFRLWGIEQKVREAGLEPGALGNFTWRTTIAGEELGSISYREHADDHVAIRDRATVTPEVSCAQDVVERLLRDRLRELTGAEVCFGTEVEAIDETADGSVELAIRGGDTIRARYAVAADGAGSRLRSKLGIEMAGPEEIARFLALYLHVDLSPWTSDRPAVLYWVVNSQVQGVFISMDGDSRYTFHVRADSAGVELDDPTVERCEELVRSAVGSEAVDVDIRQIGHWVMSGQVADRFRAGSVFLAGDCAHRYPPTGGFGMNSGIQDAHNLAWKLAAVLGGWAPESLLSSYESERRPIDELFCRRSVENFHRLEKIASWSQDPRPILSRLEANGPQATAERRRIRDEISRQRDHFDKLSLELGFVYPTGALVPDEDGPKASPDGREPYHGQAWPGARAPMVILTGPDGESIPTTDLFERDFILMAAGAGGWEVAVDRLAEDGVPVRYMEVGRDLHDPDGAWAAAFAVQSGGSVIVRPDGHVAFRCRTAVEDPDGTLASAMKHILAGGNSG